MFSRMAKSLLGLLFWSGVTLCALVVTGVVVTSNYLSLAYAFYLQRYDGQPLSEETFIGPLFQTFAPEATLAQLYSAGIAVALAGGLFLLFNKLFNSFDSWQALKAHRAEGNSEQANAFKDDLHHKLLCIALLLVALIPVINWDVSLFRFRGAASANNLDSPDDAVDMVVWDKLLEEPSFAMELTRLGSWGYIAMTASICVVLEITARKARRYADRCFALIDEVSTQNRKPAEPQLLGYDTDGQPAYDSTVALAYDADGNAIAGQPSSHAQSPQPVAAAAESEKAAEPLFVIPQVDIPAREECQTGATAVRSDANETGPQSRPGARPTIEEDIQTVIGTDDFVSMREAAQDRDRYYVDMANGSVWDRAYYEALHGAISNRAGRAA